MTSSTDLNQIPKEFTDSGVSPSVHEPYVGSKTDNGSSFPGFTYVHDADLNS